MTNGYGYLFFVYPGLLLMLSGNLIMDILVIWKEHHLSDLKKMRYTVILPIFIIISIILIYVDLVVYDLYSNIFTIIIFILSFVIGFMLPPSRFKKLVSKRSN